MLDSRIYRATLAPVLFALILCAFSLTDRARPIGTTLAPDAFDEARALVELNDLARRFPVRRAGDVGDAGVASYVAAAFREMGSYQVSTRGFRGETADGDRELTTVIARQVGQPGPGLVVLAHRDAVGRGARAELSGTAALLELARLVSGGRSRRTITFVSTSGGSAGARDAARRLTGATDAVLVLGDMAGASLRRPFVVGWSTGSGAAPLQLRRTVESAVRREAGTDPGRTRTLAQWARLAFPVTVGDQGPLVEAGLRAVLLSASGERPPAANEPVLPGRLQQFGRAALRTLNALDNAPDLRDGSTRSLVTVRKVLPQWAVRLLIATLLLAPLLVVIDGFARVRRRRESVLPGIWWLAAVAAAPVVAMAFAWLLGVTGLLTGTPPDPLPGAAVALDGAGKAGLAAVLLVLALGWLVLRPALLRAVGPAQRLEGASAGVGLVMVWCALALVVWVRNPYAAALFVPGAHLLLVVVAPSVRMRRGVALALVGVAALPFVLVDASIAGQLGLGPAEFAWWCVLLVAGGIVGPLGWLVWSLTFACLIGAVVLALRAPAGDDGQRRPRITVRGPATYAGPGSLGGTKSALRG